MLAKSETREVENGFDEARAKIKKTTLEDSAMEMHTEEDEESLLCLTRRQPGRRRRQSFT